MGAGSTALVWYGMCCCSVAFVAITASALVAWGNRDAEKRRKARAAASQASSGTPSGAEPPTDPGAAS